MQSINRGKVSLFLILTFSIDWLMVLFYSLLGGKWNTPPAIALAAGYMFIPMISGIIVQKWIYKEEIKNSFGINFRINGYWWAAWFMPPILAILAFGVALLFPGVSWSPEMQGMFDRYRDVITPEQYTQMQKSFETLPVHPFWISVGQGLLAGISINALAGFGEELGWRGFLQYEFRQMKFWPMSLVTGFIWGIWHAPIILMGHNYPQHPVAGVFMMTIWCMLLSPLMAYIRLRSGSVIAPSVFHGTLNATAGLSILLISGGNDLTVGMSGLAGFIVLLAANGFLFILKRTGFIKQ